MDCKTKSPEARFVDIKQFLLGTIELTEQLDHKLKEHDENTEYDLKSTKKFFR